MATTVDQLIVEIKADTKDLQRQLKNIEGRIGGAGKKGGTAFVPMIGSLKGMLPLLAGVGTGIATISAVSGVARVGSEFEDMRDSLNQVFGSVQAGQTAFNSILTFAQTTPFQIEDVTRAFISLKGAGVQPNMAMLQTFADTASTSIDQLGAFNAMVRLVQRSAAGGLGLEEINQLDDRGIPATKILTEALGKSRRELSEFGQTAEGAADMVEKLIAGLQEQFGGAMENKMDNLSTKTSNMTIAFKELQNSVFEGGLGEMLKSLADRLGQLALRAAAFVRLVTGTQSIADVTGVGPGDPVGQNNALTRLIEEEQAVLDNLIATNDRTAARHGNVGKVAGSQERLEMLKRMQAETQIQIDLLKDLENQEKSTAVASSELSEAFGELDTVVKEAGQNLSRDFANALLEGESALESFKNFTKAVVSEIIATFINLAVVQPIISSIFAGFGGSGVSPDFVGPPKPPGLAGGGMASQGRPVLVGERGPELFVPHAPGNIINSANTRSALSGGGVVINQNISFATGVVPTVRAEVTKMLPQIADVSKAAVLDASLRGGSFAKGLRGRSG